MNAHMKFDDPEVAAFAEDMPSLLVFKAVVRGQTNGAKAAKELLEAGFPPRVIEQMQRLHVRIAVAFARAEYMENDSATATADAADDERDIELLSTSITGFAMRSKVVGRAPLTSTEKFVTAMHEAEQALQAAGMRPWLDYAPHDLIAPATALVGQSA